MKKNNKSMKVLKFFYLIAIILLFSFNIYSLIKLQIINNKEKRNNIIDEMTTTVKIAPLRGDIYTYDGRYVVKTETYYNIAIDPTKVSDEILLEFLDTVSKYTNIDIEKEKKEIKNKAIKGRKEYIFVDKINESNKIELNKELANLKADYSKIRTKDGNKIELYYDFRKSIDRIYNDYNLYQNIVGYIGSQANYGLEQYYDKELSGEMGEEYKLIPYDPKYKNFTLASKDFNIVIKEKQDGYNLKLSIDSIIQNDLDTVLKESYENTKAQNTMGIVFDIENGKVLAMSQYPKAENKGNIKNINITNLFEPGSIFKPIVTSIAINENLVNPNTKISSEGFIKVKDRIIRDHDDTTKGNLPLTEIIAHSGNVAMVKLAEMVDNQTFYSYLENFGFSGRTGIDISYETKNRMVALKNLTEVRKANMSFGQGIASTQLQILMSLIATINGGELIRPTVVSEIYDNNGQLIKKIDKEIINNVITKDTSDKIRDMLSSVVNEGTGRGVKIPGYTIGGKTGTAQKAGSNGYEKGKYYSSFFAFLPIDKPKYAIIITVDEPQGVYYGASVALPPAKKILEKLIKYKDIQPDKEQELFNKKEKYNEEKSNLFNDKKSKDRVLNKEDIQKLKEDILNGTMPNLIGLNKKVLLEILPLDYNFITKGSGIVIKQSINAGEKINNKTKIILELNIQNREE